MHLVKWIRKNMSKLMAVFVILIMVAFIMPQVLNQLAKPRSRGPEKAMWLYDTDSQISYNAVRQATGELAVLKGLFIDNFLLGQLRTDERCDDENDGVQSNRAFQHLRRDDVSL